MTPKRVLVVTLVLALAGPIAAIANLPGGQQIIKMPHYSFAVPQGSDWTVDTLGGPYELVVLERHLLKGEPSSAWIQIKIMTNKVVARDLWQLSPQEHADNVRNAELEIMNQMGVEPGLYKLHDVLMGEVDVAGKHFYFLGYTTETATDFQPSALYLHFPRKNRIKWFIMVHYTQVVPKEGPPLRVSEAALTSILNTLEVGRR